ncbi:tRNA dihydrouridine(20/20a) synthase DusA [Prochlorococcus marinus XMU1411]|uniref:tRNA dihydrouridine(20/20a) synthase DusA n=1 Tax=Prochlorococcus marinus TaxID=1219 RepID=UPI001ADA39E9|nr:tRNA dihydrouridine(20/20a) synthase DusA [Prochlorococcus marinus]MBO8242875.1 tRNA dihydrouridine(20/20a) synthase DusA [Prochlorococcus marinus XMU1411]MBW3053995.1 tRNA dihydrouridine(20/20a) synthase DusA [Prochlorococcus marinus str. MU1411]MCR8537564.1 tRNA dihydrouridine(20/20a) synthase DusA [Prochlorococcus marinus CUG1430]
MSFNQSNSMKNIHKLSIAPMMDCTDKHFRMIMRKISSKALLYTEMIVAQSLVYTNKKENFLNFNREEHPISIQLGGDNPVILKEAARMAEDWGYDEINFNVGCPSPRVCSGNFGASLMKDPEKVAICIESLKNSCSLPVTIKHRIGVDDYDSFINLNNFVRDVANAGADRFTVHARKAILKGLNPKQNRNIPPLKYDVVKKLKKLNPDLLIEINGGFTNIDQSLEALKEFDGVMIGRSVYKHPLRWSAIDQKVYGINSNSKSASDIIFSLIPYIEKHLANGGKSWDICKHLINLVEGIPKAKIWRNQISTKSIKKELDIDCLLNLTSKLKEIGY